MTCGPALGPLQGKSSHSYLAPVLLTSFFLFLRFEGWGFDCAPDDDFSFEGDADGVEAAAAVFAAVDAGLGLGFVRGGAEEVA